MWLAGLALEKTSSLAWHSHHVPVPGGCCLCPGRGTLSSWPPLLSTDHTVFAQPGFRAAACGYSQDRRGLASRGQGSSPLPPGPLWARSPLWSCGGISCGRASSWGTVGSSCRLPSLAGLAALLCLYPAMGRPRSSVCCWITVEEKPSTACICSGWDGVPRWWYLSHTLPIPGQGLSLVWWPDRV